MSDLTSGFTANYLKAGDVCDELYALPPASVDLIVTDPPYNIGVDYEATQDNLPLAQYHIWCSRWIHYLNCVIRPGGSVWIFINDENVSELDIMAKATGFTKRNHVVWHYTFGQSCAKKLARSHTHILHYIKGTDIDVMTFNRDAVLVPSMRQLMYKDKRAIPAGKIPDDVWVLNPKYLPAEGFKPDADTWTVSRVCGTFNEKQSTPNQLPESLVARIVRLCSNPGDIVLDPFLGSGTTAAVAKKLDRRYIGFDISQKYVDAAQQRVDAVAVGDPITKESK